MSQKVLKSLTILRRRGEMSAYSEARPGSALGPAAAAETQAVRQGTLKYSKGCIHDRWLS